MAKSFTAYYSTLVDGIILTDLTDGQKFSRLTSPLAGFSDGRKKELSAKDTV